MGANFAMNPTLILVICFALCISSILINKNYKFSLGTFYGITVQLFFIFFGVFVMLQYNKKPVFIETGNFKAVVLEVPQEKAKSYKSVLQVASVFTADANLQTKEKLIAYFAKNNMALSLKPGDEILFNSTPKEIRNYNNPYEFDYKNFLERKRIYRQVYLNENQWIKTNNSIRNLKILAEIVREKLLKSYCDQGIHHTELEILSALTLGYKRDLDPETRRVFTSAGASHILAVSGLHVGIVYWVIFMLLGFLREIKFGKFLFVLITIVLLWAYAFITGLSPSVMRAATMFTIFVIGENLNRKSNIYNSLAASAFILLLINPNNLFEPGFQLSYSAVFGIVFLQPKIEKLITVKSKILKFIWTLLTISIAAQITTSPITVYYFGQFPSYFWTTNTFMIPAAMLLIPFGFVLLIFSHVVLLSNFLSIIINLILKLVYSLLLLIEQLPSSVIYLSANKIQLILFIAVLISIFLLLNKPKIRYIKSGLIFLLFLIFSVFIRSTKRLNNTEFIAYNTPKNQSIHLIHGKKNYVISENKLESDEKYFHPSIKTAQKLGLEYPIFYTPKDSFRNNEIIIQKNFIFFEGKIFSFNKNYSDSSVNQLIDFYINPSLSTPSPNFDNKTLIISNKRTFSNYEYNSSIIHNTLKIGAFRKKW